MRKPWELMVFKDGFQWFWEKHYFFCRFCCGTMWHYVALLVSGKNCENWWFPRILEINLNFCKFCCGTMWHYVALRGAIGSWKNHENWWFQGFREKAKFLVNFAVALCGTMWHYVALLVYGKTMKIDDFQGFWEKAIFL